MIDEVALAALIRRIVREELAAHAPTPDEYLSITRAAQVADVSTRTVRRWIDSGALPGYGHGRARRVRRADLDALLANGRKLSPDLSPEEQARLDVRRRRGR